MPSTVLEVASRGPGLTEITEPVAGALSGLGAEDGLLTLFARHTSCSLLIQENADPDVRRDLEVFFQKLVPQGDDPSMSWLRHVSEGPDDMPAHIKAALTATSLSVPVAGGRMTLGGWQGVYLFEHRAAPRRRMIVVHYLAG
ncbi:MAG: secondary thiamine-phosphate synthase enzyme YjbQ [Pseudomonadota bacterium]